MDRPPTNPVPPYGAMIARIGVFFAALAAVGFLWWLLAPTWLPGLVARTGSPTEMCLRAAVSPRADPAASTLNQQIVMRNARRGRIELASYAAHHDPRVRLLVASMLKRLGVIANEREIAAMAVDDDPRVREYAVDALCEGATPPGVEAIIGALADPVPAVRVAALRAAGARKLAAAAAIAAATADPDPRVRLQALGVIGSLALTQRTDAVIARLDDHLGAIRTSAALTLTSWRPRIALTAAQERRIVDVLLAALGEAGATADSRSGLAAALDDWRDRFAFTADEEARIAAARAAR